MKLRFVHRQRPVHARYDYEQVMRQVPEMALPSKGRMSANGALHGSELPSECAELIEELRSVIGSRPADDEREGAA